MTTPDDQQGRQPDPIQQHHQGYPPSYYPQPYQPYQQPYPPQAYQPAPSPVTKRDSPFRRGFGLGTGAGMGLGLTLLVLSTLASLVGMLVLAGLGAMVGESTPEGALDTAWGSPSASKHLRSIEVNGAIMGTESDGSALMGGTYGYEVAEMIDDVGTGDAEGLLLELNTPGGTIYGARAIADAVERYKTRTGKKVTAYVRGMSASGGMYAMAGADQIIADHGTLVGSIGVIMGPIARYRDVTALQSSLISQGVVTRGGITEQYLTQGKGKDFGNPFRDMTTEERTIFTRGLVNEYNAFVNHVAKHRGIPAATIKNSIGAHVYDPKTAISNKLIDKQLGQEEAYRAAATLSGIDAKTSFNVQREQTPGFLDSLLGASSRVRGQAPPAESVGGKAPVATSVLCTGRTVALVYAGDPRSACG